MSRRSRPPRRRRKMRLRACRAPDPALVRFSLKVGVCVVIGYAVGLLTQRAELSTILTTVLITALPTYGAALRKMILRIVGAIIGGAVSLLAIIIVTPNFETLPAYLLLSSSSSTSPRTPLSPADALHTQESRSARPSPWCSPA